MYNVRLLEDRWATLRHVVEAVAIVCAGAWAFYTFIYQEKIKPAGEAAALNVSISVTSLARSRTRDILNVTSVFHNTGRTEIEIAADGFNVWGERYAAHEAIQSREKPDRRNFTDALPIGSRRLIRAFAELRVAAGGPVASNIILEPDESETIPDVIAVPRGEYDLIVAQVVAIPVKTSVSGKIKVAIVKNRVGGYWLVPADSGVAEDDNNTNFALPP